MDGGLSQGKITNSQGGLSQISDIMDPTELGEVLEDL